MYTCTFIEFFLLILGLKFSLSLLNVISKLFRNLFIPVRSVVGSLAIVLMDGTPSNTITLSARYVAIMKSCSTMNAVFLACKINLNVKRK